jgi:hypothetical protein
MSNNKSKKKIASIVTALLILALIIAAGAYGWISLMPGYISPDKAVENYFKAITNEDSKLYKKSCYTTRWRDSVPLDDSITEALSMQSGATYDNVHIISRETLDEKYATAMSDSIYARYGFDQKISSIMRVNFSVDTVFDGQSLSSGTITRYCYKSGGKWFFLADPDVLVDLLIEG